MDGREPVGLKPRERNAGEFQISATPEFAPSVLQRPAAAKRFIVVNRDGAAYRVNTEIEAGHEFTFNGGVKFYIDSKAGPRILAGKHRTLTPEKFNAGDLRFVWLDGSGNPL